MASSHDFFVFGDHEAARQLIISTLQSEGFAVTVTSPHGLLAKRGSGAATFWLGSLAGKSFQVSILLDFMVDEQGRLVARLNRNIVGGALKGGAIGAARTDTAFQETANAIATALQSAGVLVESLSQ